VFAGVRQSDGEPARVRLFAGLGAGDTAGQWLDVKGARVVAAVIENLDKAADRRAIAAELRASADLIEKTEAEAG
jgi:hypothetical protein